FHADVGHQRAVRIFRKPLKSPAKKEAGVAIPIKALNSLLGRKGSVTIPQNTESSSGGVLSRGFLNWRLSGLFLDLLLGLFLALFQFLLAGFLKFLDQFLRITLQIRMQFL